jgi:hypothetical protein
VRIQIIIRALAMRMYRKSLSITLATLLLASSFPAISLGTSLPSTLAAAAKSNFGSTTLGSPHLELPFLFNGAPISPFATLPAAAGSDFVYVFVGAQTFGDVSIGGTFRGEDELYTFTIPSIAPGQAHIMLESQQVGRSCNTFQINGTQVGLLSSRGDSNVVYTEMGTIPSGVLRAGANTLYIRSLNTNCTSGGDLDEFAVSNAVIFYHIP